MSAATGFTQEQLTHFQKFVQHLVLKFGITGNLPLNAFLNKIRMIHGSPAVNSDETRTQRFFVEVSTGTVAAVSAAGAYTGTDFSASVTQYENLVTIAQQGATYSLAERNIAKLTHFIGSIDTSASGIKNAAIRFINEGYGMMIQTKLLNKIATKVKADLVTILEAGTSDTVYGDTVYASSGTLLNQNNLVTGAFADSSLDSLYNMFAAQQDYEGNGLFHLTPSFFCVDQASLASMTKIIKNSMTVNDAHKNILDFQNANGAVIVPLAVSSGVAYVFTDDNPLVFLCETTEPVVKIGFDELGNLVMRAYLIYKFGWSGRQGTAKVTGA